MPRLPLASMPAGQAMAPRDGALKPASRRKAVDLPQPEGPSRDRNSPGRTSRSNRSSATTPFAYVLPTPRSATMGGASKEARVSVDIAGLRLIDDDRADVPDHDRVAVGIGLQQF